MSPTAGPDIRPDPKPGTGFTREAHPDARLAILAVLARAGERGVSRDRLAVLLCGDTG